LALQALEQAGLVAADVGPGARVDDHVDVEAGAEDVPPGGAVRVRVVERGGDPLEPERELAPDVDERLRRPDRVGGDERAAERLVEPLVAAVGKVGLEGPRPLLRDPAGDDRLDARRRHAAPPCPALPGPPGATRPPAGTPAGRPTVRRTRFRVPCGGTSSAIRPARRSVTSRSKSPGVTLPKYRQFTARQGASPHRAM